MRAKAEGGETVLGAGELETHACYLIYGIIDPGQKGRVLNPGAGHEEILCLVAGMVTLTGPEGSQNLKVGEAVYIKGDVTYTLENPQKMPAVYIAAGGHSEGGHQH
jgi:mannose-6-phosphate isomerase-like protein (cupin superfamily)